MSALGTKERTIEMGMVPDRKKEVHDVGVKMRRQMSLNGRSMSQFFEILENTDESGLN